MVQDTHNLTFEFWDTDYFSHGLDSKFLPERIRDTQLGGVIYLWPISYTQGYRATRYMYVASCPEKYGRGDTH